MEMRELGDTGLKVSLIGLGTMTWGEQNSEAEAHAQMDFAVDHGVNFIDTAEMYPVPPKAETQGRTEEYIGTWIAARKNRDKIVLATKVIGETDEFPYLRGGKAKLDKKNITEALDASLKRLRTDYIDLYQTHWPDRATNYFGQLGYKHDPSEPPTVPIEETLEALQGLVKAGKVRHIGISNETPWGMMQYLNASAAKGLPRIVSIQNPYNLLNRSFEVGLAEMAIKEKTGLLAYSPLAFGVLAGTYLHGARPPGARLTLFNRFKRYSAEHVDTTVAEYAGIAQKYGFSFAQMSLAFVNRQPFVTSNIIGATDLTQLRENIESAALRLPAEVLQEIEEVHKIHSNPCP